MGAAKKLEIDVLNMVEALKHTINCCTEAKDGLNTTTNDELFVASEALGRVKSWIDNIIIMG